MDQLVVTSDGSCLVVETVEPLRALVQVQTAYGVAVLASGREAAGVEEPDAVAALPCSGAEAGPAVLTAEVQDELQQARSEA